MAELTRCRNEAGTAYNLTRASPIITHMPTTDEKMKYARACGSTGKKLLPILLLLTLIFGQQFIIRRSLKAVRAARGAFSLFILGKK